MAAIMLAAAALTSCSQQSPAPKATAHHVRASPTAENIANLPSGPPPRIPYLHGGALHVGGRTIATGANQLLAAGGTVLVSRFSVTRPARWSMLTHGKLEHVSALDGADRPELSTAGDLVAWSWFPTKRFTRVTTWDPSTGRENHVDIDAPYAPSTGGGQTVELIGVDSRDQAFWRGPRGRIYVWRPGDHAPAAVPSRLAIMSVVPHGVVAQANSDHVTIGGVLGTVDDQGRFSKVRHLPVDQQFAWSPNGRFVAYAVDPIRSQKFDVSATTGAVIDVRTGRRRLLALPPGSSGEPVTFESNSAVLVIAGTYRHEYLLRCPTTGGACQRILSLGNGDGWRIPGQL